jgi:hypothetical protein
MAPFSRECYLISLTRSYIWQLVVRLDSARRDNEDLKLRNDELQRKLDAFTRDRRRILETLDLLTDEKKKAMETVRFLTNKVGT